MATIYAFDTLWIYPLESLWIFLAYSLDYIPWIFHRYFLDILVIMLENREGKTLAPEPLLLHCNSRWWVRCTRYGTYEVKYSTYVCTYRTHTHTQVMQFPNKPTHNFSKFLQISHHKKFFKISMILKPWRKVYTIHLQPTLRLLLLQLSFF